MAMDTIEIQAIVFDIGGVFLHPDPSRVPVPEHLRQDLLGLSEGWNADELWERYKRGGLAEEEYWKTRARTIVRPDAPDWTTLRDWWDDAVTLDVALRDLARSLSRTTRLAALSNAGAELERRLVRHELADLFEVVVNSHRVGMAKPEEAIYRHIAERLRLSPDRLLFIDDKPRNLDAAATVGLHTHQYASAMVLATDLERRFGIR
jgi:putative hydrolase of the HAD superfamily